MTSALVLIVYQSVSVVLYLVCIYHNDFTFFFIYYHVIDDCPTVYRFLRVYLLSFVLARPGISVVNCIWIPSVSSLDQWSDVSASWEC